METLNHAAAQVSGFMWSGWLFTLLLGTGVLLTFRLRGIQFSLLGYALRLVLVKEREGEGDVSHLGALMTALAATVGVGNIAGVATAITMGGPGAVFWMWITALFGMATKYSEAFLAVKYRRVNHNGEFSGGPMFYLEKGLGSRWLSYTFAFCGAVAALGVGNMIQANTTAAAFAEVSGIDQKVSGVFLAAFAALVILGGIKRIADVTTFLVPLMIAIYFGAAFYLIVANFGTVLEGMGLVFQGAFTGTAAVGGFAGATVAQAMRFGISRSLLSNECGLGSAPIAAAAAITNHPAKQALVSMTGAFIDTFLVCTLTAMALLSTGVWSGGEMGVAVTLRAFEHDMPAGLAQWVLAVSVITFAFSTILGWEYYGEKCFEYLTGMQYLHYYRVAWVFFVYLGAVIKIELVWNLADILNAMMAIPNLIGLIFLSGELAVDTSAFRAGIENGTINKWD